MEFIRPRENRERHKAVIVLERGATDGPSLAMLIGLWALALVTLAIGLGNATLSFVYPLELELREGTSWLHVLATNSGVDIYDHAKVAFINMAHGPLNPIIYSHVARWFPFLSSGMVL